jgi:oxaloacetate decarboxylase beta subunit
MTEALLGGLDGLLAGGRHLVTAGGPTLVMLTLAGLLLYLALARGVEPLLLVPIGFGCFLANLPLSGVAGEGGVLRTLYDLGIGNELFPLLIFVGVGAMTDFTPLLANPRLLLFGAAGQLGIFCTLLLALALGFPREQAVAVAMIGACDGPTVIYVANLFAEAGRLPPAMVGSLAVAAYSYMALVPVVQPPLMRLLTTERERAVRMPAGGHRVSRAARVLLPLVVTAVTGLVAPQGLPLMGMLMLGNFLKVSGVVPRLTRASEHEIANVATLFLGLAVGGTMAGPEFLQRQTLLVFALGLVAIVVDTVGGIMLGKAWCLLSGGKVNPLLGAAGISAYPMAARLVQTEGQRWNRHNFLLMPAMAANTGGQIGSVMAAAILLSVLKGMGLL